MASAILARPVTFTRQAIDWIRLNKVKSALFALVVLSAIGSIVGGFSYEAMRREAAEARASVAIVERNAAREARASCVLRNMILAMERSRASEPTQGKRNTLLAQVREAFSLKADPELRDRSSRLCKGSMHDEFLNVRD